MFRVPLFCYLSPLLHAWESEGRAVSLNVISCTYNATMLTVPLVCYLSPLSFMHEKAIVRVPFYPNLFIIEDVQLDQIYLDTEFSSIPSGRPIRLHRVFSRSMVPIYFRFRVRMSHRYFKIYLDTISLSSSCASFIQSSRLEQDNVGQTKNSKTLNRFSKLVSCEKIEAINWDSSSRTTHDPPLCFPWSFHPVRKYWILILFRWGL
jgi:hypothetical protein